MEGCFQTYKACKDSFQESPTRELADQVSKEIRKLARFVPNVKVLTLCGGIPLRPHLASLAHEPHLVVGTPGRILELLQKGALPLANVRVLVLDEADRMLDMGEVLAAACMGAFLPLASAWPRRGSWSRADRAQLSVAGGIPWFCDALRRVGIHLRVLPRMAACQKLQLRFTGHGIDLTCSEQ